MNNRISSVRPINREARYENQAPAPLASNVYQNQAPARLASNVDQYQPRPNERLYQAPVTSVHAVVGPPEQRCWVEREQVVGDRGGANVPGAIAGAVIGGILGHQVGGGRGRDVATVGGAIAGGAVGANAGGGYYTQDVQRCASAPGSGRPEFWDVTYDFQGQQHRVQMSAPPGPTITVNGSGDPRG